MKRTLIIIVSTLLALLIIVGVLRYIVLEKLEEKVPVMVVIVFSFFILSLPKLNSLIVRFIPKLSSEGGLSLIGIAIKSLIMGIIYLVSSIFI